MDIGVISEDRSDIDVLYELTCKLVKENECSFKMFSGTGCGKLRRKCTAWAQNLLRRGCSYLIIIHDLDQNNQQTLYQELRDLIHHVKFKCYVILIPIREIEAWLLSDPDAIQKTFNLSKKPKIPKKPELVQRPKEKLRDLVWSYGRKRYLNTIHNSRIAANLKLRNLKICKSFSPYPTFIKDIFAK